MARGVLQWLRRGAQVGGRWAARGDKLDHYLHGSLALSEVGIHCTERKWGQLEDYFILDNLRDVSFLREYNSHYTYYFALVLKH